MFCGFRERVRQDRQRGDMANLRETRNREKNNRYKE
jgi:hypothetical protein